MEEDVELLPLYILPTIGYVEKLISNLPFQMALGERYRKQTDRSRFQIAGPNNLQVLSLPIVHPGNYAAMAEVKLNNNENWQIKHWRSIETSYRKAPFFEYYAHHFEPLFQKKYGLLAEISIEAIYIIFKILKFEKRIVLNFSNQRTISPINAEGKIQYQQVFIERHGFIPDVSILDLIFNEGPNAMEFLKRI